jgi:hypothetical protein
MKRLLLLIATLAFVAILALQSGASSTFGTGPPAGVRPEYLALGDSLAAGIGASDPDTTGYVPLFHSYLGDALDPGNADPTPLDSVPDAFNRKLLWLENLGVGGPGAPPGGETTGSMIAGGQLDAALAELSARNGNAMPVDDVRIVTLDIGATTRSRWSLPVRAASPLRALPPSAPHSQRSQPTSTLSWASCGRRQARTLR